MLSKSTGVSVQVSFLLLHEHVPDAFVTGNL